MNRLLHFPCIAWALGTASGQAQSSPDDQKPVYKDGKATAEARTEDLLQRLTLKEKIKLPSSYRGVHTQTINRLGIPSFEMTDGPQGGARRREEVEFTRRRARFQAGNRSRNLPLKASLNP